MKKVCSILLLIVIFSSSQLFGQARVDNPAPNVSFNESSEIIIEATGWKYNKDETLSDYGKWESYQNMIPEEHSTYVRDLHKYGERGRRANTSQNFVNIQTKTILINGVKYYILLVNKLSGYFQDKFSDWRIHETMRAYIFDENEFCKLNDITSKIEMKTRMELFTSFPGSQKFLMEIYRKIVADRETGPECSFHVMKAENGAIRFYLPSCPPPYSHQHNETSDFDDFSFEKSYFEMDLENFNKILIDK